jgi:hypothetical protein
VALISTRLHETHSHVTLHVRSVLVPTAKHSRPVRPIMRRPSSRSSHSWLSVAVAVPMFLVGVTAIGFAHGKALNAGEIRVPTTWFPGYALNASSAERPEVKAVWTSPDGVIYLGTRIGLFRSPRGGAPEAVRGLNNVDVKGLASMGGTGGVFAATRDGVFRVDADSAQLVLAGDRRGSPSRASVMPPRVFRCRRSRKRSLSLA